MFVKKIKLKDLNYQYINNINKEVEIQYLEEPLKVLLSKDVSSKFSKSPGDVNKKIIDSLLEKEKNNEVLMFIFNMKFRDWIDLYLLKKKVTDFEKLNYFCCQEIEEKMPKLNQLLSNILERNDGEYLSSFILFLYNYERYFNCKRERRKKKKIIK